MFIIPQETRVHSLKTWQYCLDSIMPDKIKGHMGRDKRIILSKSNNYTFQNLIREAFTFKMDTAVVKAA